MDIKGDDDCVIDIGADREKVCYNRMYSGELLECSSSSICVASLQADRAHHNRFL